MIDDWDTVNKGNCTTSTSHVRELDFLDSSNIQHHKDFTKTGNPVTSSPGSSRGQVRNNSSRDELVT